MTRAAKRPVAGAIRRRLETTVAGCGGPVTIAKRLRITDMTVRHWLKGRNLPSADALIALHGLGVSPDWLLFGVGKPPTLPYVQPKLATKRK